MVDPQSLPLPPGSSGWPLVGETLRFLRNGVDFVESRVQRLGPVFRTHLLGRPAAFVCGPEATELFQDDARVVREGAMPGNVQHLFAGHVLTGLDGDEHRERKAFILAAMTPEALADYVPGLRRAARATLAARAAAGPAPLVPALKALSLASICQAMFGLSSGPVYEQLVTDYPLIIQGLSALPLSLPGTAFTKAKKALRRVLAAIGSLIQAERARPANGGPTTGLGRILAARSPVDGQPLPDDTVAREVHHVLIAGFIVWCWTVAATRHLAEHERVRELLRSEALSLPDDYGPSALMGLPAMARAVMETQRMTPILPLVFGRAKTDFVFKGHRIPAGWMVLWAWHATHMRPEIYPRPSAFEPERFANGRSEHQAHRCAFAPTGSGDPAKGHKCAGHELGPLMLRVYLVELLRGYDVALVPQDLSADPARLPPEPRTGLIATVTRRV